MTQHLHLTRPPRTKRSALLILLGSLMLPLCQSSLAQAPAAGTPAPPEPAAEPGPGLLPSLGPNLAVSGFGTLGVARSNRDFTYQRFIGSGTGFKRDSLLGIQADWRISPQWSATVQLKAAPALESDHQWSITPTWAFVAWRPGDDWLLRAGRIRMPLYLFSESMDVGQTHDMVRLPTEVYSTAPSTDFDGLDVTRSLYLGDGGERELSATLYYGKATTTARFWARDGLPPTVAPGPLFRTVDVRASGLALMLRQPDLMLRGSVSRTDTRQSDGASLPVTFPYVPLGPGFGYYQTDNNLPGPGVPQVASIANTIYSLGGEWMLGGGWRVAGEWMRNRQYDTEFASDTHGHYLAVFKQMGRLTPYASVSRLGSRQSAIDWYNRLTNATLPPIIPGASQLLAAQRLGGEGIWVADQRALALGASYVLSPSLKLKGEWLHTRIGQVSRLIDVPPGSPTPHDTTVNVWSANLNFTF